MNKKRSGSQVPLVIEEYPSDYNGYPFLTLIQYDGIVYCTVVDNANEKQINAFVLDFCKPEGIDEEELINIIAVWYETDRTSHPLSIAFSLQGLTPVSKKLYKVFHFEFVSRVMGPLPSYSMGEVVSIRRKRKKFIPMERIDKIKRLPPLTVLRGSGLP